MQSSRMPAAQAARAALVFVITCGSVACTPYVVAQRSPDPGASERYRCPPATEDAAGVLTGECVPDTVVDEERFTQSGTTRYPLPRCPNGIRRMRIGGGDMLVECAAPDRDAEEIPAPPAAGAAESE